MPQPLVRSCYEKTFFSESQMLSAFTIREGARVLRTTRYAVEPKQIFKVTGVNRGQSVEAVHVRDGVLSLDGMQTAGWNNEGPVIASPRDDNAFLVYVTQAQSQSFAQLA
jgi:hypothetical protein